MTHLGRWHHHDEPPGLERAGPRPARVPAHQDGGRGVDRHHLRLLPLPSVIATVGRQRPLPLGARGGGGRCVRGRGQGQRGRGELRGEAGPEWEGREAPREDGGAGDEEAREEGHGALRGTAVGGVTAAVLTLLLGPGGGACGIVLCGGG